VRDRDVETEGGGKKCSRNGVWEPRLWNTLGPCGDGFARIGGGV